MCDPLRNDALKVSLLTFWEEPKNNPRSCWICGDSTGSANIPICLQCIWKYNIFKDVRIFKKAIKPNLR
jgi:hypothetical protein